MPRDLVDELLAAQVKARLFGAAIDVHLERWKLIRRIGSGATGTVFEAHDPKLDRRVAIKVLHHRTDRMLAEARALAKLAHPNVVGVFDTGETDGLAYIVMELAPGTSLRTWAKDRPWREVMHAVRDAAQGIAAAHDAGLVHRDLKPENILVGEDRARVVDFGSGGVLGTEGYMAPEVVAGSAATAASDQYSLGVALADVVTEPPAWLRNTIAKMRAAEPGDRYPNMHEVVRALRRDRRRLQWTAAIAVAAICGAALGVWTMHEKAAHEACLDGGAHRASVWNEGMRAGVKAGLANAPWTTRTLEAFDNAGAQWEASYRHVCEATRVHGNQSDALLELRMRCLDRALDRLGALATELAGDRGNVATPDMPSPVTGSLDPAARAAAPAAVAALPNALECETLSDPAELALPTDPAARDKARAVEHELDRGWAAFALGRYRDARAIAARAKADPIDAPAVHAAVLVLAAATDARVGLPAEAHASLAAALDAAANAHAGALELDVWARMLRTELFAGDPAKVIEWAPFARAAAARANREGAEIDGIVAEAERDAGHLVDARKLLDHALNSKDPLRPDQIAVLELNLASIDLAFGDSPKAHDVLVKARDRVIGVFGDHHPELALYDDKLADAARARGKLREAFALHDQSAQLRTDAFGPDDRTISTTLFHRAQTELEGGDIHKAEVSLHRAIAIREKVYGEASARLGELYVVLGDCDLARGDVEGARTHFAKAAQLDPRVEVAWREYDAGMKVSFDQAPFPVAHEALSLDRASQYVAHEGLLMQHFAPGNLIKIAAALRSYYLPTLDPAMIVWIARGIAFVDRRPTTADMFAAALANAGEQPSRTALSAAIGMARCEDPRAAQAARTALSLYQAMPELGRADMPQLR